MSKRNRTFIILAVMVLMAVCAFGFAGKAHAIGLQAKKTGGNSVVLRWKKDKNAAKYILYRCEHRKAKNYKKSFKIIKTLNKNTACYTDKRLSRNMYYDYKLCMVDKKGNKACYNGIKTVFIKK